MGGVLVLWKFSFPSPPLPFTPAPQLQSPQYESNPDSLPLCQTVFASMLSCHFPVWVDWFWLPLPLTSSSALCPVEHSSLPSLTMSPNTTCYRFWATSFYLIHPCPMIKCAFVFMYCHRNVNILLPCQWFQPHFYIKASLADFTLMITNYQRLLSARFVGETFTWAKNPNLFQVCRNNFHSREILSDFFIHL